MSFTPAELHETLIELSNDQSEPFTLSDGVTESDVDTWLSNQDVAALETQYDDAITRSTIPTLDDSATDTYTLREIIESRNDDPSNFESGYAIRADRTIIQYHKPWVGGKKPMTEAEADSLREEHVSKIVNRAVKTDLVTDAKVKFRQH